MASNTHFEVLSGWASHMFLQDIRKPFVRRALLTRERHQDMVELTFREPLEQLRVSRLHQAAHEEAHQILAEATTGVCLRHLTRRHRAFAIVE